MLSQSLTKGTSKLHSSKNWKVSNLSSCPQKKTFKEQPQVPKHPNLQFPPIQKKIIDQMIEAESKIISKEAVPVLAQVPKPPLEIIPNEKEEKKEPMIASSEDAYACMYCNGSKVNKAGKPCKKCKGTGKMAPALIDRLRSIVKAEISTMFESEIRSQASQLIKSQQFSQIAGKSEVKPEHTGTQCNVCGIIPIKGIRYQCGTCSKYDLCEECEKKVNHEHPLLKIRNPSQKPAGIFTAMKDAPKPSRAPVYKIGEEVKGPKYSIKMLSAKMKDGEECAPGQDIENIVTFENNGTISLPKDSLLKFETESKIIVQDIRLPEIVPGGKIDVKINAIAPTTIGKHVSYFSLYDIKGQKVPQKFWLDIKVVEPESSLKLDPLPAPPKKVEVVANPVAPRKMEEPIKVEEAKKEEKKSPEASKEPKTIAEQIKKLQNSKIEPKYMDNMTKLIQAFETYDIEVLYEMLKGYKNDINLVTDFILSTSQMKQISIHINHLLIPYCYCLLYTSPSPRDRG
eukprot:TRINITY_DN2962_c0_g1_i3.p1 TRINITY_DN2962_c0_g1~~TRINITY_DN2962_c0_g1_i3.p1  ORF type:complete len:512 (-),score=96.39 TRINITY_DN2962_c0_g1_i3:34-1569(-)